MARRFFTLTLLCGAGWILGSAARAQQPSPTLSPPSCVAPVSPPPAIEGRSPFRRGPADGPMRPGMDDHASRPELLREERRERRMGPLLPQSRDPRGLAEFGKGPFLGDRLAGGFPQRPWMAWLPPEERETFAQNLKIWHDLPPEQQEQIRERVRNRIQQETDEALLQSGLHLDHDRQEIFELRYSQERRKLERELHQKMEAERAQRLPGIVEQLKREFSAPPAGSPAPPVPQPAPKAAPQPSPSPKPL